MSAGVAEAPLGFFERASDLGGGSLTLEERLDRALACLRADGVAECPVCRSHMTQEGQGGHCLGCGSRLS